MNSAAPPPIAPLALVCEPGQPWPRGATCMHWHGRDGVNFAVDSHHAERLQVCLFDTVHGPETARLDLPAHNHGVWHGFVAGLQAGQLYGLRAHGPYQPALGHRFNPAKLLLDPFAKALVGDAHHLALELDYGVPPLQPDPNDNAVRLPKACVLDVAQELALGAAITPCPPLLREQVVLYEAHVKGLTQSHPEVPSAERGSYAGVASAPMLAHYARLGVTTLCLLPVHQHLTEAHLLHKGLRNYWGYNTLNFFVPEPTYASGLYPDVRAEFRFMVDQLHRHGLEVVLDVVFNHSAEGDALGPTLSWRGLDNASWYLHERAGHLLNFSGCGNSLDLAQPCAQRLVMDSLRWWVQAFGVDGFRFDLATALGRDVRAHHHFHPHAGLLAAMAQDPVLARVRLIAEPWDLGPNGYQLGHFPLGWLEWNDRFRDSCRAWWLGHETTRGELARRLSGSSDVFHHSGRGPQASVNLITAHDGMTLADLTAYAHKHNQANGEDNRDGHPHNFSANAGVEGPSSDAAVLALRGQWRRALLATLFCAQGTPQLLAGDEIGHSQQGNNNAYCQDNPLTWLNWAQADTAQRDFVAGLIHLRHQHAALHHAHWFTGRRHHHHHKPHQIHQTHQTHQGQQASAEAEAGVVDITWRTPDGAALSATDWEDRHNRSLVCLLEVCEPGRVRDASGAVVLGLSPTERWLLIFHASAHALVFVLPPGVWLAVLDSAAALVLQQTHWHQARQHSGQLLVAPRSVLGLVQPLDFSPPGAGAEAPVPSDLAEPVQ
jgi:glycogen debranching enzyme GlgX